jgi:Sulfotransferase family
MNDADRRVIESVPSPPIVIGATGGSGTRVAARIVQRCGVYIGVNLNPAADARDLARYSSRWVDRFLVEPAKPGLQDRMLADLARVLEQHLAEGNGPPWGWKEPRSILLLPFFARVLPGMRFVHVLRDGRDIAFSRNQNQPRKHGRSFLGTDADLDSPTGSITLWREVNLAAARFGEGELGERYLRIRFEDLCAEPEPVIGRMLGFLELSGDPAALAREVQPPPTIARWRHEDAALVEELERIARPALERFGYV